jgi:hypothetical protein
MRPSLLVFRTPLAFLNVDVPITVDSTRPPEFSDLPHAPALEANLQQGASVFAYSQALTYGAEQILSEK